MNTRHAQLVLAVVREGSFTAAAKSLFVTQPTLSQQLNVLREAGIVETRREGKQIFYRLTAEKAARLVGALYTIFCTDEERP